MTAAAVVRVMRALGAPETDVRFVGGAVRNAVMNLPVHEIDIATPDLPEEVAERLRNAGIKAVPTGLEHGTIMAVADGEAFEITTLRRDTTCDGRHAAVAFTSDWQEDARRRDFTMNAMSMRPDGMLFDDHDGRADALAGRVRFVGDPADRIQEDYLRILRLFRFYAWYGRAPLDAATLAACKAHAAGLERLSGERIQQEFVKLLSAPAPGGAVKLMIETGVLQQIFPDTGDISAFEALLRIEQTLAYKPDWLRRFAALLPAMTDSASEKLKLSRADRDRLKTIAQTEPAFNDHTSPSHLRHALYYLGADAVIDRLLVAWARTSDAEPALWRALLAAAESWTPRTLPVGGDDVLTLGVQPGPTVGRLLAAVEAWWIGAGFIPDREQTLAHLVHLVANRVAPEQRPEQRDA